MLTNRKWLEPVQQIKINFIQNLFWGCDVICYTVYQETRIQKKKKQQQQIQKQILNQIETQLPLSEDKFNSHSVYKFWGNLDCLIVKALC